MLLAAALLGIVSTASSQPSAASAEPRLRPHAVDTLLRRWVERHDAAAAQVVVVDADSGAVRVARAFRDGSPTDRLTPVPPGSTLKPFIVAAALEAGLPPSRELDVDTPIALADGEAITDWTRHGRLDVAGVLARSSNVGAAHLALVTPPRVTRRVFREHGLAAPPNVLPSSLGRHDEAGLRATLGEGAQIDPVALTRAYAILANGGRRPDGTAVLSQNTASALRAMLEGVVSRPDGTAHQARRAGRGAAGKTGTAVLPTGRHTLFAGWVPHAGGATVILVDVAFEGAADGRFGGNVAAPAFAELVRSARAEP